MNIWNGDSSRKPDSRMTPRREIILEALRELASHPTADELFETVRRRLPRISLGTVYRNLETLAHMGLIVVLEGGAQRRYDAIRTAHYHMRCIQCGRIDDAPIPPDGTMEESLRGQTDYVILGHRLEFVGVCPKCRKEEDSNGQH